MHRQILYVLGLVFYCCSVLLFRQITVSADYDTLERTVTQSITQAVDTTNIQNPIRDGAYFGVQSPDGTEEIDIINVGKIQSFDQAQNQTLSLVRNIINYALSFIAMIVFIYLIFEGYQVLVAGADEQAYKSALTKLKNAAIAIAGIAMSRVIVSFIFYIIGQII